MVNKEMMLPRVSRTFHGRDIFAPAAAHLANRIPPKEFGPEIATIVTPRFAETIEKKNEIVGEVLFIDDFGNIITNITEEELRAIKTKESVHIRINERELKLHLRRTYSKAKQNEPFAIIGSHNFIEISMNRGNAALELKTQDGDKLAVHT
jgi:S-adenosylmethionine hydrolase